MAHKSTKMTLFLFAVLATCGASSGRGASVSLPPSRAVPVGTWGGVLLPVLSGDEQGLDWATLKTSVNVLVRSGLGGVYTSGTAEEMWTLTDEEFVRIGDLVAEEATKAKILYQIGCSLPS